ncbi:PKD domain-containing protein [candidate division KSB1 bacterium]|nr:PKD domain-containing protein [candidate division KSB1 bacterium]
MKISTLTSLLILILCLLLCTCEVHKDPFSALNKIPAINVFSFESDSLKYTNKQPFDISYLSLNYADNEKQQLTATFRFIIGSGKIFHTLFKEVEKTNNSITFSVPSSFDSEVDGRVSFVPDKTGLVKIEMELSDKVKQATKTATTFFYRNLNPVAIFDYQLLSNVSPYKIQVDATKSYDRDNGVIEWYYWTFENGAAEIKTRSRTYQYTYQTSGTYSVKLRIEDDDGGVDSTEQVISTMNQPPLAVLQVEPISGEAPLTIHYTATNSTDSDGDIVSYRIDFDDGASSLDSVGIHTYTTDDNYRIKLRVQDNLGQTDTTSILVKVATHPVAVLNIEPTEGPFPLSSLIYGTNSYDPQGGKLEYDIYIDGILKYDNIDSVIHTFDIPKLYLVQLIVTNNRNKLTAEAHKFVTAKNLNPLADFNWSPTTPQHLTPITYTSTSTDPNLTDEITYYKWTFPNGIITEGADKGIVTQTFDAGVETYTVKLEVWDKFEGYNSITKTISK